MTEKPEKFTIDIQYTALEKERNFQPHAQAKHIRKENIMKSACRGK